MKTFYKSLLLLMTLALPLTGSFAQPTLEAVVDYDALAKQCINKAIDVLIAGIIQVQYARDIDCYFKDEIQDVIIKLISIKDELLESR